MNVLLNLVDMTLDWDTVIKGYNLFLKGQDSTERGKGCNAFVLTESNNLDYGVFE